MYPALPIEKKYRFGRKNRMVYPDPLNVGEMGQSPEMWACKRLRTKHFHGISSGNQHPYLLKSRYGKVSHLSCPVIPKPAEGKFHCPYHEGVFDLYTGQPLAGPPRRPLPRITLDIRGGRIYATGVQQEAL